MSLVLLFQLRNREEVIRKNENVYCSEMKNEFINACCINTSVSNIKMSMYENECRIYSMMQNSVEDNAGICQLTNVLKIC